MFLEKEGYSGQSSDRGTIGNGYVEGGCIAIVLHEQMGHWVEHMQEVSADLFTRFLDEK